jgi:4-hydroxy-tetrahydrodipicolinate synthase
MMAKLKIEGILPAFPTPTTDAGDVDEAGLRKLVEFLIANGVSGLVPMGGTGEFTAMSPAARARVVAITAEVAARQVPVVAGILSPGFAEALQTGRDFTHAGADALMLIAPFYVTPTQPAIRDYFRAFRDRVELPVLHYDIPSRTRIVTEPDTIAAMAEDGSIIGMKACNGDIHHFNRTAALVPSSFALLSGEDTMLPVHVAMGACGGVLASAALVPRYWVKVLDLGRSGRIAECVAAQRKLLPLLDAIFAEMNPGPLKEALAMIGLRAGHALPPLSAPSETTKARLRQALDGLRAEGIL